jgi:hypothetical protein
MIQLLYCILQVQSTEYKIESHKYLYNTETSSHLRTAVVNQTGGQEVDKRDKADHGGSWIHMMI